MQDDEFDLIVPIKSGCERLGLLARESRDDEPGDVKLEVFALYADGTKARVAAASDCNCCGGATWDEDA